MQHGLALPDTPPMAVHRGRLDLLEMHLRHSGAAQPDLPPRGRSIRRSWDVNDEVLATQGTLLAGATLLPLCVDYDELDLAR